MRQFRQFTLFLAGLFLGSLAWIELGAQEETGDDVVTLINGVQVRGQVTSVGETGLDMMVGRTKRSYPWYALAPGTRYRFDTTYRMNLSGYLRGAPAAELTNTPDPEYDPPKPPQLPAADIRKLPIATSGGTVNAGLFAQPKAVSPAMVNTLAAATSPSASLWAMQFGAAEDEVAVYAFSVEQPPKMAMLLTRDGKVTADTPAPRTVAGEPFHAFAKKNVAASLTEDTTVEMDIEWLLATDDVTRRLINADVRLARGTQRAAFVLQGAPGGFTKSLTAPTIRTLLTEPALSFTIQLHNDAPVLVGRVRMGRLNLIPRSGMDLRVNIEVVDSQGRVQMKRSTPFATDIPPDGYPLRIELSQLFAGQSYKVMASISLGAFFGNLTYEEIFILPDALKF